MRRYLRLLGAAADEIPDLMQEAFVGVIRDYPDRDPQTQAVLLRAVARHRLVDLRRRSSTGQESWSDAVDAWVAPRSEVLDDACLEQLARCLRELSARGRMSLMRHHVEGSSVDEVASELGLGNSGARSLLQRSRDRLRGCMARAGFSLRSESEGDADPSNETSVGERYLDLLLAEHARAVASHGSSSAPGGDPSASSPGGQGRGSRGAWGRAACLLGGSAIAISIGLLQTEPGPSTASGQDPMPDVVVVGTMAEIRKLPARTANVRLTLYTREAVHGLIRLRGLRRLDASFAPGGYRNSRNKKRPKFFPAAFEPLGLLSSLEELDISGHGPIKSLQALTTLSRLRRLRINKALLYASSLAALAKLPRLEDLEIDECCNAEDSEKETLDLRAPRRGMASLAGIHTLRRLVLRPFEADADTLKPLAKLANLVDLDIECSGSPDAYRPIAALTSLRRLKLHRGRTDAAFFKSFRSLTHLEEFEMEAVAGPHGKAAGATLAALPRLRRLSFLRASPDLAAMRALSASRSVEHIEVRVRDNLESIRAITKLPGLKSVKMGGADRASLAVFRDLPLQRIDVARTDDLKPPDLLLIPPSVRHVAAKTSHVDGRVLRHLRGVRSMGIYEFDDQDGPGFMQSFRASAVWKSLEVLKIHGDWVVGLEQVTRMPALKELDLLLFDEAVPASLLTRLQRRGVRVRLRRDARKPLSAIEVRRK